MSDVFNWQKFWNEKGGAGNDFQATGRGLMDIPGFLHTIREIALELELSSGDDVLDIGCGTGIIALAISPFVRTVKGIDISEASIKRARNNCDTVQNLSFAVGNILELDHEEDKYTKVLAYSVLQYLRDENEILQAFKGIKSILAEGGIALMAANPDPERYDAYMETVNTSAMSEEELANYNRILDATLWVPQKKIIPIAEAAGLSVSVEPISEKIWQHFYMYNLVLRG